MGRRNFQGGNKTKGMAKRSNDYDREIRIPLSDEEEYVIVTAVCGNGRFKVSTSSNTNYLAVLPGSMRGSKKRNSYVELNSVLLINNRSSWQTYKENAHVDIVHVYSQNHITHLKLRNIFQTTNSNHNSNDCDIVFQNQNLDYSILDTSSKNVTPPISDDFDLDII